MLDVMTWNCSRRVLATCATFFLPCALAYGDYSVETSNGVITGHPAPNVCDTVEFLGIPYAKPPVGDLRWAAPVPPCQAEHFVADSWGYDCPQTSSGPVDFPSFTPQAQRIIDAFGVSVGNPQSEDCLTLNVWAPPLDSEAAKQPVLVFIHGGRFAIGGAHSSFYNGSRLAEATGAVVVTLTYRLNIFGFPGAPNNTQNLGLRDQRRAVEWVHENIAGFGGDAGKITVFGQSSGGVAADWWTFAYKDDPLISGIISESGNAFSFPLNTPERQASNWDNVTETLGCSNSENTLTCMQAKNWTEVLAASARLPPASGGNPIRSTPPFYPRVDNETVFSDYASLLEQGKLAKIPQLLGNNNNEQGYYVIPAYRNGVNVSAEQADQFLLESFTCPNDFEARARSALGIPVWQYRYFGDWDNIRLYPASGAYHGTETEAIFGNSGDVSGIPPSATQEELTRVMQDAWVAFADCPGEGLTGYGWPKFDPEEQTLVRLGFNNSTEPDFVKPAVYSENCPKVQLGGG